MLAEPARALLNRVPPARAAFDRVAYQRAYMKRWRARKAGEGD